MTMTPQELGQELLEGIHLRNSSNEELIALIRQGADVGIRDDEGDTPLIKITWNVSGNYRAPLVNALIEAGADPEARNHDGFTALSVAAMRNQSGIIQALIDKGAKTETSNNYGMTPLMVAAQNGHCQAIETLISAGANVHATGGGPGLTTLHIAAANGHRGAVKTLLRTGGADPEALTKYGQTPRDFAEGNGSLIIAEMLCVTVRRKQEERRKMQQERAADLRRIEDEGMNGVPVSVLRDTPRLILKKKPGVTP